MSSSTDLENVQPTLSGESKYWETPEDKGLGKKKEESGPLCDERKLAQTDRKDGARDDTADSVSKAELSTQPSSSVDEVSSSNCDEGEWASLYLEEQYLAEAVAFFTFKNTVQELDKATKKLADSVLGQGWLTDKKKRKDLPAFVTDAHGKTLSKPAGECWSMPVLLKFLPWLAKEYSLSKFEVQDKRVQAAGEICQSICAHVENITLFDVWLDNRPAPPPKDIVLELNEYKLILTKLGCESAVRIVAEEHAWLVQETGEENFATCVFNTKDVRVAAEVAKMAVVFQAFHFVEERIYRFCRDIKTKTSLCFAKFLKAEEEKQPVGLAMTMDFIGKEPKFFNSKDQIAELATCMKAVSINIRHLDAEPKKLLSISLESFEKFLHLRLKKEWFLYEYNGREILSVLKYLVLKKKRTSLIEVKILPSNRLKPVLARKFHHWITPHRERFIGRKKELRKICNLLKKRASNVMIAGPSGIGKSSLVQEAAFRLRSAWPSQFVIDASTQFSFLASITQVIRHYGLLSKEKLSYENVVEAYNLLELSDHRILLILENFNSVDLTSFFTVPQWDYVALIIVTRQPEHVFTKRLQGMLHLTIELPLFSSAESAECFAELTGKETPVEVLEMHRVILSHLNNFPVAVQVAKALLKNFTSECVAEYESFFKEHPHGIVGATEMRDLALSSETASAISTVVSFALSIIRNRQDIHDLGYLTALVACPSVPNLPSLSAIGIDTEENVFSLERLGLVFGEHYHFDKGEQACFRMHASVAHTLQSKILALPLEQGLTHLLRYFTTICRCLFGEGGGELDIFSKDKVTFSALCFENTLTSIIEQLCERITTCQQSRLNLWSHLGQLYSELALFISSIWKSSEPRFAVNPALSFDLFEKSLHAYSYFNQKTSFFKIFQVYEDFLMKYGLPKERAKRLSVALNLAVTGGLDSDAVLIEEDDGAICAARAATVESNDQSLDWASLYINHADMSLRSPAARFVLTLEKAVCLGRQERLEEENELLLLSLSEADQLFGKNSVSYGNVLYFLGLNFFAQGDKCQASRYYTEALRNLEKHKDADLERKVLLCLFGLGSVLLLDKSNPNPSRGYLKKALACAERNSGKESELYSRALCKMADLEEALGNFEKGAELRQEVPLEYQNADFARVEDHQPKNSSSTAADPSNTSKKRKKKKRKKKTKGASTTGGKDSSDADSE